jgi:hypothetical protein
MSHLRVWWRDLGETNRARTDGTNVWFDTKMLQVERRCSAAHEAEHLRRGQHGCVGASEEERVRHAAAKWLVPDPHDVADAIVWADNDVALAADHLWLDEPSMLARTNVRLMHPAERALIQRLVMERLHP